MQNDFLQIIRTLTALLVAGITQLLGGSWSKASFPFLATVAKRGVAKESS